MYLGLIIDQERLLRESIMLASLTAGLAERDVQVTAIVPEAGPEPGDPRSVLTAASVHGVRMQVPPWMRRARTRSLAAALGQGPPEILHAIGGEAWNVGLDLAKAIERPVTLDLWTAELLPRIPPGRAAECVAGYVVPTEPLAEAARQRVEAELVSLVPMGVAAPPQPREILVNPDASMSIAIVLSGVDPAGPKAMLTGLSRLTTTFPQIQACLELRGPAEHEIWRHARRLNLLGHISAIGDAARHRPLLTGCDVLAMPEPAGHCRTLLLQAMGLGMPVIAAEDPFLDMLVPDETALVVEQPDPDEWADKLRAALTDADLARRLGRAARAWVTGRHRPQEQAAGLARVLQQVLSGGAHAFSAGV